MNALTAEIQHVESSMGDFDVLYLKGAGQHIALTAYSAGAEVVVYKLSRKDIKNIRKVCDDWLLQDFLKGER